MPRHRSHRGKHRKLSKAKRREIALRNLRKGRRALKRHRVLRRHRSAAPYGSGRGILGSKRPRRCSKCGRVIFGGMKGLRTHMKKRHRRGRRKHRG